MDAPKKGSREDAMKFWENSAPGMNDSLLNLLTDIYNFQANGVRKGPIVQRSVILEDGRILRLYGSLD